MSRKNKATAFECNQLGATFYQSGAVDLAIEQFRLAVKRAPWISTYWLNLGVALLDKEMLAEAEAGIECALRLNPESQSAYFHLAQLYRKRGDETETRRAYEKAIAINPFTHLADRAREYLEGWRPRIVRTDSSGSDPAASDI